MSSRFHQIQIGNVLCAVSKAVALVAFWLMTPTMATAQSFMSQEELLATIPGGQVSGISNSDGKTRWAQARKPLSGMTVAVTRPAEQADGLREAVEQVGGTLQAIPPLAFESAGDPARQSECVDHVDDYDWIVFTSANAVDAHLAHGDTLGICPDDMTPTDP